MPQWSAQGPSAGGARALGVTLARAVALASAVLTLTTAVGATAAAAAQPASAQSPAPTPPAPTRFVTDGAEFLSAPAQDELEQRLERYERDTGHQVLLWIGQTTAGEPLESWAARAFSTWRVGRKSLDDGVAVFILAADRRVRIEVGYGLEDRVPDVVASRIIGDGIVPRLRAGDRDGAARVAVAGVLEAVGGEAGAPREATRSPGAPPEIDRGQLILVGIIALLVLGFLVTHPRLALMLLTTIASDHGYGGRRGRWGGGSHGGWGGGFGGGGFGGGGGGFSGGGGRSGGGGASGSW